MNKNYQKGRRFEYQVVKEYEADGWVAMRTAGSHGFADVIAINPADQTVDFVQCKVTESDSQAARLCNQFKSNPPLPLGPYRQLMVVKVVRGDRKVVIIERIS